MKVFQMIQIIKQRQKNRAKIFWQNRKYKQLQRNINEKQFSRIPSYSQPFFQQILTDSYQNIITRLFNKYYDQSDFPNYLKNFKNQDFFKVYEASVAIFQLVQQIQVWIMNRQIFQHGIISSLVQLLKNKNHPFLQVMSVLILTRIVRVLTREQLPQFINADTVPCSVFIDAIFINHYSQRYFSTLFQVLSQRGHYIDNSDENVSLFDQLQGSFRNSATIDQRRNLSKLISSLKIRIDDGHSNFAKRYYLLKRQMLLYFEKQKDIVMVQRQFQLIDYSLIININDHLKIQEGKDYITILVNVSLSSQILQYPVKYWELVYALVTTKTFHNPNNLSVLFGMLMRLLNIATSGKIRKNTVPSNYQGIRVANRIYNFSPFMRRQILDFREYFEKIVSISQCRHRETYHYISEFIILLIKDAQPKSTNLIQEYSLLKLFFQQSLEHGKKQAKNSLLSIFRALLIVKSNNRTKYEILRKVIISEDISAIIGQLRNKKYIEQLTETFSIYQEMKIEVIQNDLKINYKQRYDEKEQIN